MIEPGIITYNCDGAMDFTEKVCIELLGEPREGFTEINPSVFMQQTYLPHLQTIMDRNMFMIFDRTPQFSDRNPDVERRWKAIYYKCWSKYHHSHDRGRPSKIQLLTLEEAMNYIKEHELDLHLTEKALNKRYSFLYET